MFGIGPTELIVLLVIGLIVLGPERLPQVASQVGKAIRDFRRMSDDMTGEFQRTLQLDELTGAAATAEVAPTLTAEPIATTATPNGASESFTFNLAPQVVPSDPPNTSPPEATVVESADVAPPADDVLIAISTVATKADPHAGASLLDMPPVEEAAATEPEPVAMDPEPYAYAPTALPESPPLDPNVEPTTTTEAATVQATNGIADAWDAVIHTEATRSLPTPEEAAAMATVAAVAVQEPARPRIDPAAEVTIREVIEAQVAAEAFRERRRLANYRRTHRGA